MIFTHPTESPDPLRSAIQAAYLADEAILVNKLLDEAAWSDGQHERVANRARKLVIDIRNRKTSGLDAFLSEYDLSSEEGVMLMCLSEALLRIPDSETADRLIHDKLANADWDKHLGRLQSLSVNAATLGLMLTGGIVKLDSVASANTGNFIGRLVAKSSEPIIRMALKEGMRILGHQFVMGRTIEEAVQRSHEDENSTYRFSYDMLGEAALTQDDADRYFESYASAIEKLSGEAAKHEGTSTAPGISVKLSALHPRFEFSQHPRLVSELVPRVVALALMARDAGIGMTVDAEEAERLEPTLDIFEAVLRTEELAGWQGLGIVVQAYQKRATAVIDWLTDLGQSTGQRIMLRLVKGAYWDTEIKRAQEQGLAGFPVFTRKVATDVSYLVCARKILQAGEVFYPQFATHNAHTVAAILELAGKRRDFEFQRLHGMGEALYEEVIGSDKFNVPCRVYAPVGGHEELLPYLVRRLLENGANTSFINRISNQRASVEALIDDPVRALAQLEPKLNPRISLPGDLFGKARPNSSGINLNDIVELKVLAEETQQSEGIQWQAAPLVAGKIQWHESYDIVNPANNQETIGKVSDATEEDIEQALYNAYKANADWKNSAIEERLAILLRAADLLEQHRSELITLIVKEGGRTIPDAVSEVREAVDYCRYYAWIARQNFSRPLMMPGPTGERNELSWHGRGVFVCISPWNFPLAIFTGQVVAALVAGNTVIAKPASQTPLIAMRMTQLLHQAGVPVEVLHLLPGSGSVVGQRLVEDQRVSGIAFTGSTETARQINLTLAKRAGPIVPFIAETGGQNAMIVDSSALTEQVVPDVLSSIFNSSGQRCSALRVLFLQQDIADRTIGMLKGAMKELSIGDPALLVTDVGPVIDKSSCESLNKYCEQMRLTASSVFQLSLPEACATGSFVAPAVFEIEDLAVLKREIFGPVLHVIRYDSDKLDDVIDAINNTGYGLTLGIHTRIEETAQYIQQRVRAGNVYVNRNMIGAVVGVQPFGGEGLSGTGPKAGGPHYLQRFASERTSTTNTTAVGGNATLLSIDAGR